MAAADEDDIIQKLRRAAASVDAIAESVPPHPKAPRAQEYLSSDDSLPRSYHKPLDSRRFGHHRSTKKNVLLFITTHLSREHMAFLRKCWPPAMHKSRLLRDADVVVSVVNEPLTRDVTEALAVAFPPIGRKVAYRRVTQSLHTSGGMARQTGAMVSLDAAEREGLFSTYNWIVRLNPDVIIRDDGFLREAMARKDVDAVFANCNKRRTGDVRVMTDFTAWRPKAVQIGAFRLPKGHALCTAKQQFDSLICNSERAATRAFRPVLESGRYVPDTSVEIKRPSGPQARIIYSTTYFCLPRVQATNPSSDLISTQVLLPNATLPGPDCRIAGAASSVLHRHDYLATCRAELASLPPIFANAPPSTRRATAKN